LLHPRSTGFEMLLEKNCFKSIIDLTFAIEDHDVKIGTVQPPETIGLFFTPKKKRKKNFYSFQKI